VVRVLVWDDEASSFGAVRGWLGPFESEVEIVEKETWSEAAQALIVDGPWNIVVADMLDTKYSVDFRAEYLHVWQRCECIPDVRELLGSQFAEIQPSEWQKYNLWGTGLLLLAKALRVPEVFVLSAFVGASGGGGVTDMADRVVIALCNMGVLRGGILEKREGSPWSRGSLLRAVESCLSVGFREVVDRYILAIPDEIENYSGIRGASGGNCLVKDRFSSHSADISLTDEELAIVRKLASKPCQYVSGKDILMALNNERFDSRTVTLSFNEQRGFLRAYEIELISDKRTGRDLCSLDNEKFCRWQMTGDTPTRSEQDGFSCYSATNKDRLSGGGICAKKLEKTVPGELAEPLDGGSHRRLIMNFRNNKLRPIENMFPGISNDKGLIRSLHAVGYALSGHLVARVQD
jgi:hypothetical protein